MSYIMRYEGREYRLSDRQQEKAEEAIIDALNSDGRFVHVLLESGSITILVNRATQIAFMPVTPGK
jgi:hypothetical protein